MCPQTDTCHASGCLVEAPFAIGTLGALSQGGRCLTRNLTSLGGYPFPVCTLARSTYARQRAASASCRGKRPDGLLRSPPRRSRDMWLAGTLQDRAVQLANSGWELSGPSHSLPGYSTSRGCTARPRGSARARAHMKHQPPCPSKKDFTAARQKGDTRVTW
jgi:hypothetical protein